MLREPSDLRTATAPELKIALVARKVAQDTKIANRKYCRDLLFVAELFTFTLPYGSLLCGLKNST